MLTLYSDSNCFDIALSVNYIINIMMFDIMILFTITALFEFFEMMHERGYLKLWQILTFLNRLRKTDMNDLRSTHF